MIPCDESVLCRTDAPDLLIRHWHGDASLGRALIVHGFGEHSGRYGHVAEALVSAGLEATAFDLRGHGGSQGTRAFVEHFDDYLDDVDAVLATLDDEQADTPLFLLGHSMGGLVAALWVLERGVSPAGLILSSPGFAFALRVPAWKATAGRICSRLTATTARWYTEALAAQARAFELAPRLAVPLLCQAAGADALVDPRAARRFFDAASSHERRWISYDDMYHEIYNELERERVLADLTDWIGARLVVSAA